MNEGQDSLSPDTFQQDLDSATSGILRIVPCEPEPFIGDNVKEPAPCHGRGYDSFLLLEDLPLLPE